MSDNNAFKAIAKGGGLGFIGMAASALFQFIVGILIIRLLSKEELGLISLSHGIIAILAMISSLGLINGVPRFLAKSRAVDANNDFSGIASAALSISIISSLIVALLVFIGAEAIASLLSKPGLVFVIRAFSIMIPAMVMIKVLTAIFRGNGEAKPKLIFEDILANTLRFAFVILVALIGQYYVGIVFAYVSSIVVAAILYITYARRVMEGKLSFNLRLSGVNELLLFSINLLGLSLVMLLMDQIAVLILGYLKPSEQVALYSAPLRLAQMMQIPLQAMSFMFLPFATTLFEKGQHQALQELYLRVTKWTSYIAMPIFLALVFDTEFIITLLFGTKYIDSAPILQILSTGFFFNTLVGLNGQTLIAFGRTQEIMIAVVLGLCTNVLLAALLVPGFGALGSALSVAGGLFISNTIMSTYLALRYGISPVVWTYFKALLFSFLIALGVYLAIGNMLIGMNLWAHAMFLILLCIISVVSPFVAKSVDEEDIALLSSLEQKLFRSNRLVSILGHWVVKPQKDS